MINWVTKGAPLVTWIGIFPAVLAPMAATTLGWIATEKIRQSCGALYGLALSVIESLFYPILVSWISAFTIWNESIAYAVDAGSIPSHQLRELRFTALFGAAGTAAILTTAIVLTLLYLTRKRTHPRSAAEVRGLHSLAALS